MTEDFDDLDYWGDMPFPADRWGRCPLRGAAVRIAHEVLLDPAETPGLTATRIVDRLVEAGVLPDEMRGESMRVVGPLVTCPTCGVVRTHVETCSGGVDA